jgi:hypothetical protein
MGSFNNSGTEIPLEVSVIKGFYRWSRNNIFLIFYKKLGKEGRSILQVNGRGMILWERE